MTVNILNEINGIFDEETVTQLAEVFGSDRKAVANAIQPSLAAVTLASLRRSSTFDGAEHLLRSVSEFDGALYKNFSLVIKGGSKEELNEVGRRLAIGLFKEDLDEYVRRVSKLSGATHETAKSIINLITPLVLDMAGEERESSRLNRNGVTKYFEAQKTRIGAEIPEDIMQSMDLSEEFTTRGLDADNLGLHKFAPGGTSFTPPLKADTEFDLSTDTQESTDSVIPTDSSETSDTVSSEFIPTRREAPPAVFKVNVPEAIVEFDEENDQPNDESKPQADSVSAAQSEVANETNEEAVAPTATEPSGEVAQDTNAEHGEETTSSRSMWDRGANAQTSKTISEKAETDESQDSAGDEEEAGVAMELASSAESYETGTTEAGPSESKDFWLKALLPLLALASLWFFALSIFGKKNQITVPVAANSATTNASFVNDQEVADETEVVEITIPISDDDPFFPNDTDATTRSAPVSSTVSVTAEQPSQNSPSQNSPSQDVIEFEPADPRVAPANVKGYQRIGELRIPVFDGPRTTGPSYYSRR